MIISSSHRVVEQDGALPLVVAPVLMTLIWRPAMTEPQSPLSTIYAGWQTYQTLLIAALTPLAPDQLVLRAAPILRSIEEIATHMIGARARWFYQLMGEGGDTFAVLATWDRQGMPTRSSAELVHGLETTWQGMQDAISGWIAADWQQTYPGEEPDEPATITRAWVIWHLIEHDLHHGGEIALTLGVHGLPAPAL
jgi:uncharacterized damage-inducible protein DinB